MLKNRILYLFILLCTTAFFICFNGYYSWYVFLLSLVLPGVSLILSLPGMLTSWAEIGVPGGGGRAKKSAAVPIQVAAGSRWPLPSGRIRLRLNIHNTLTGERRTEALELSQGRMPQAVEQRLTSHTCGRIVCRLDKARVCDLLGLFSLPIRLREGRSCEVVVLPNIFQTAIGLRDRNIPDAGGERYSPTKPGPDPTEFFGLRDYRPGDKLNRVDWKLSDKAGALLVREGSLPVAKRALFIISLNGDGNEADLLMDTLATLGHSLSGQGAGYAVAFSGGEGLVFIDVDSPEDSGGALEAVLRHCDRGQFPGLIAEGAEAPRDIARVVYICPEPEPAAIGFIGERYAFAGATVVHTRPLTEGNRLEGDMYPVRVQPGSLAADLAGLQI
ncbi:MAG: DUF58 domain-containing protein [Acutalibacter sp.]|jgi:uncharacterized protein (DUF58 family)|uniref:DUF58 domain-containing protein n=1 Tax=Acutalibacter sp. TaxID=1918636 RepID=UPI00216C1F4B|nr:DUF58 domain-containing protein [Acutalibacter sp.]MCI9224592.1 DUF58 domain-containing protein [Acutalibacter sp.]